MSKELLCDKLCDILEAIEIVESRMKSISCAEDFIKDDEAVWKFDGICMRLQAIGETLFSIKKIDPDFFEAYADENFAGAIRLRHFISHHYSEISEKMVYDICTNDIPSLKNTAQKAKDALPCKQ